MGCWAQRIVLPLQIACFWISAVVLMGSCQESEMPQERLPYFNSADFTPIFISSTSEVEKKVPHHLSSFGFHDQNGNWVDNSHIENKIHVANFMFTSCGNICPKMTNTMKLVSEAYQDDENVVILSYSVMPWVDTQDVLAEYVTNKGISDSNWHFLTGNKSKIYELARKSYFAEEDIGFTKDSADFLHTEHFILVDENQRIRGVYNGTLSLDVKHLIVDIKTLKQEN